jgi:hypothetical protein
LGVLLRKTPWLFYKIWCFSPKFREVKYGK